MARKLRLLVPGLPVHVLQRGVNRAEVFGSDRDRLSYLEFLGIAADKNDCAIHCYVLMSNHIHMLVTPGHEESLPAMMQALNTRYVWHFNDRHERTGGLWEGRYHARIVDTDPYLKICYQYIELNPVRAGMCSHPAYYSWSSHRCHAQGEKDPLVSFHAAYLSLGNDASTRQSRYQNWFQNRLSDEDLELARNGA